MTQKRRSDRDVVLKGALLTRTRLTDGAVLNGSINDLSYEGVRVMGTTEGLSIGDTVSLTIRFPFGHDIEYTGLVRHIDPGTSYGVELINNNPEGPSPTDDASSDTGGE
jgi:hypothetical protein